MKIWFTGAVMAPTDLLPFRPGVLSTLIRLHQEGHLPAFDMEALREDQRLLLEAEGLSGQTLLKAHCEVFLDRHGLEYALVDHDGEILKSGSDWDALIAWVRGRRRVGSVTRTTRETDIRITVDLDGSGKHQIRTGLHFFDHMLEQIARHGYVDLSIECDGDLHIDEHHTIEDVGIALGEALLQAVGTKTGIERYGYVLPMDEAQAIVALDWSGRPHLEFDADLQRERVGDFPVEMTKHFFQSVAMAMKATLHIRVRGENDHHRIEACFKGFARTLKQAVAGNPKAPDQIPSSKGLL